MHLWCLAAATAASSVLLSGCEGCNFSFGPIPTHFTITFLDEDGEIRSPEAAPLDGTLEICTEGEETVYCQEVAFSTASRWTWSGSVGWEGYVTCRVPDLWFVAAAEGCTEEEAFVPGGREADAPVDAGVVLRCAG